MSVENSTDAKNYDKILYRNHLAEFAVDIKESDPNRWWTITASHLRRINQLVRKAQTPELRTHIKKRVGIATQSIRESIDFTQTNLDSNELAKVANNVMMSVSIRMAEPFCSKEVNIKYEMYSLNYLCDTYPDYFEQETGVLNNNEVIFLKLKNPNTNLESVLPCPINKKFWHKGGGPRYATDVVVGSPQSMKDAELPLHDLDGLTAETLSDGYNLAISMGVDPDGIEYTSSSEFNPIEYFQGRDTTQNQVLLGADGLYISEYAMLSAKTGHIAIIGELTAGKAIYNVDKVIVGDLELVKPRGLYRLMKVIAEEKAKAFDYLPVNSNFDIGLYILFLAKKFSDKDNFSNIMQKVFYLMKQMGQILPKEKNIYQVLERAHLRYPFFDFGSEINNPIELAEWKVGKLVKQADREARWDCDFPSDLVLKRVENDTVSKRISLDGYGYDKESGFKMKKWWPKFLERSNKRTINYKNKKLDPIEIIFNKSDKYDLFDITDGSEPDNDLEI